MDSGTWTFRAIAEHILIHGTPDVWEKVLDDKLFAYELKAKSVGEKDSLQILHSLLPTRNEIFRSIKSGVIKTAREKITFLCGEEFWIQNQNLDFLFRLQDFVELIKNGDDIGSLHFARQMFVDLPDNAQMNEAKRCFYSLQLKCFEINHDFASMSRRQQLARDADAALLNFLVGAEAITKMKVRLPLLSNLNQHIRDET